MSTWLQLDFALYRITAEVGGVGYLFTDSSRERLSPSIPQWVALDSHFTYATDVLDERFGPNYLSRGRGERTFIKDSRVSCAVDVFFHAFLYLVVFPIERDPRKGVEEALDEEHNLLCGIIKGLPPTDGGGGAAPSQVAGACR